MKFLRTLNGQQKTRLLFRVLVGTAAVGLVSVLTLAVAWILAGSGVRREAKKVANLTASIADARTVIAAGREAKVFEALDGGTASRKLQSAIERLCLKHRCVLAEFQAASDPQPYISRFRQKTDAVDWLQLEVKGAIRGSAADAMAVLTELKEEPLAYEFNDIEFGRMTVDAEGRAIVDVRIQLRVLFPSSGSQVALVVANEPPTASPSTPSTFATTNAPQVIDEDR